MSKFVKKLTQYLPQHSDVFGLKIFADSSVPKHKLEHTANVLYQYLDNDEDGKVDNAKVLKALVKRNGGMIINDTPQSEEIIEPKYRWITEKYDFNYSRLYTNEIRPDLICVKPTIIKIIFFSNPPIFWLDYFFALRRVINYHSSVSLDKSFENFCIINFTILVVI